MSLFITRRRGVTQQLTISWAAEWKVSKKNLAGRWNRWRSKIARTGMGSLLSKMSRYYKPYHFFQYFTLELYCNALTVWRIVFVLLTRMLVIAMPTSSTPGTRRVVGNYMPLCRIWRAWARVGCLAKPYAPQRGIRAYCYTMKGAIVARHFPNGIGMKPEWAPWEGDSV